MNTCKKLIDSIPNSVKLILAVATKAASEDGRFNTTWDVFIAIYGMPCKAREILQDCGFGADLVDRVFRTFCEGELTENDLNEFVSEPLRSEFPVSCELFNVLVYAKRFAEQCGGTVIHSEHLLLAMLYVDCIAGKVLEKVGLDYAALRKVVVGM